MTPNGLAGVSLRQFRFFTTRPVIAATRELGLRLCFRLMLPAPPNNKPTACEDQAG
jgi:hypothetical protein